MSTGRFSLSGASVQQFAKVAMLLAMTLGINASYAPAWGKTLATDSAVDHPAAISQSLDWNSALRVARLLDDNQNITDLVLQLDVLDKPATSYANAVYQVFARREGSGEWVEIHTNRGARLIQRDAGPVTLEPEIIPVEDLLEGLEQEFGAGVTLEDVELNCVSQVRYDIPGGGRDLRQTFELSQAYVEIIEITAAIFTTTTTTTTTVIPTIPGIPTGTPPALPTGTPSEPVTSGEVITLSNGFRITFIDVVFNGTSSTWRYYMEELPSAQDLSNWVLGLPRCARVISATPRGEVVNPDPNAQISGIKWQPGGGFIEGEFSVTLEGSLQVGSIQIAAKGPDVVRGTLSGPICGGSSSGSVIIDIDDEDDHDHRRRNCNQGIGNGAEGCDPGNSRPHGGSNDEGGRRPGRGNRN